MSLPHCHSEVQTVNNPFTVAIQLSELDTGFVPTASPFTIHRTEKSKKSGGVRKESSKVLVTFQRTIFWNWGCIAKRSFSAKQSVCLKTLSLDNGQNEAGCHGSVTSGSKKKRLPFWQALQNGVGYSIISSKNSSVSCINRQTPFASSRCCKSWANAR